MKSVWFTAALAADVLAGRKMETVRPNRSGLPNPGEVVRAQCGPRPPFALLTVDSHEIISIASMDADRQSSLQRLYPHKDLTSVDLVRLRFRLTQRLGDVLPTRGQSSG